MGNKKHYPQVNERLNKLISACLDNFSTEEVVKAFNYVTDSNYCEKPDPEDMIGELAMEGYCIFKPDGFFQAEKLREYAETYVFPYHNEQTNAILF